MLFVNSIDWLFLAVILIGGRYWGRKYFKVSKNPALNFLAFATGFAVVWLFIGFFDGSLSIAKAANLFLTYLFTTSFYELLGKKLFVAVEGLFGVKENDA